MSERTSSSLKSNVYNLFWDLRFLVIIITCFYLTWAESSQGELIGWDSSRRPSVTRTTVKSWISSTFGHIQPCTAELAALGRLRRPYLRRIQNIFMTCWLSRERSLPSGLLVCCCCFGVIFIILFPQDVSIFFFFSYFIQTTKMIRCDTIFGLSTRTFLLSHVFFQR